jgi:hypothetical protein
MKRLHSIAAVLGAIAGVGLMAAVSPAFASSVSLCVPTSSGNSVTSGACSGSGTTVQLPASSSEQETLLSILPHIKYEEKGVASKPTIRFSGVNVQIVNGEGKTATVNGEGNLVLGYDETGVEISGLCPTFYKPPATQTGSHNLIVGSEQSFTSYGGIDAGACNTISGPWDTVLGGALNIASASELGGASISGGKSNKASGPWSWIGAGIYNKAEGNMSSISGGSENRAEPPTGEAGTSSILGGRKNTAVGEGTAIDGGEFNKATYQSWIGGGLHNTATGKWSSVSGGSHNTAPGSLSWIGGGLENAAEGEYSAVYGGHKVTCGPEEEFCAKP